MSVSLRPVPRTQDPREIEQWWREVYQVLSTTDAISWDLLDKASSDLADLVTRSHQDLQDILSADETSADTTQDRHVSDSQVKALYDHANSTSNPHVITPAQISALASASNLSDLTSVPNARTNLGLGSMAVQDDASVDINGGAIDGTVIGANTPSSGALTSLVMGSVTYENATTQTTSSAVTTLWSQTLSDESACLVEAHVVAKKDDASDRAAYVRRALVYRDGGAAVMQGAVSTTETIESDAAWDCTVDVSGNDVRVRVTGKAATTIDWDAHMKMQDLS